MTKRERAKRRALIGRRTKRETKPVVELAVPSSEYNWTRPRGFHVVNGELVRMTEAETEAHWQSLGRPAESGDTVVTAIDVDRGVITVGRKP